MSGVWGQLQTRFSFENAHEGSHWEKALFVLQIHWAVIQLGQSQQQLERYKEVSVLPLQWGPQKTTRFCKTHQDSHGEEAKVRMPNGWNCSSFAQGICVKLYVNGYQGFRVYPANCAMQRYGYTVMQSEGCLFMIICGIVYLSVSFCFILMLG